MLYWLGSRFFRGAVTQFFSEIRRAGHAPIEHGPLLVVGNHPNQFLDPLLVLAVFRRDLWFLAKATLFRSELVGRFLSAAHLVPVFRKQDNADMSKNAETFSFAAKALRSGKAVVIFPEGTSSGQMSLAPLKSGAARIALQALAESDFALPLKIQAAGITYGELTRFRSSVTVSCSPPLEVQEFGELYRANPVEAVHALTNRVEELIRSHTVELPETRHARLVERIGRIYRSRGSQLPDLALIDTIVRNVEALAARDVSLYEVLGRRIGEYLEISATFNFHGDEPLELNQPRAFIVALTPLVILGAAINYVPYRLVALLVQKYHDEPVYQATSKLSYGLLVFSCWYGVVAILAAVLSGSSSVGIVVLAALLLIGVLTNRYLHHVRIVLLESLWPGTKTPVQLLRLMRDSLIEDLERTQKVLSRSD